MISHSKYEDRGESSSKLLAWCSCTNNRINVVDLDMEQEKYASFDGVQLCNKSNKSYKALLK